VFENGALRRIFGPKREEVAGDWRRLHNEELHNLYASPHTIRVIKSRTMRWVGHVVRMGYAKNEYSFLVGKPERKRSLGKQRGKWEDNIRMDLRDMMWEGLDRIHLAQDRDQWRKSCDHDNESSGTIKGEEFLNKLSAAP
jgi:hypothetical protein